MYACAAVQIASVSIKTAASGVHRMPLPSVVPDVDAPGMRDTLPYDADDFIKFCRELRHAADRHVRRDEQGNPPADGATAERHWLTIRDACAILGVDQSTLRRWSDAGKVPVFLTPGGHRRYAQEDILALAKGSARPRRRISKQALTEASLSQYAHDQYVTDVRQRPWYGEFDAASLAEHRQRGLAMVTLAVRYVSGRADREEIMADACEIARAYGRDSARHGLGIGDAVQMYLRARTPIIQGVIQFLDQGAISSARAGRIFTDVVEFMDRTLSAMMQQYERDRQEMHEE
jgi:excisionase family DNA binding protein